MIYYRYNLRHVLYVSKISYEVIIVLDELARKGLVVSIVLALASTIFKPFKIIATAAFVISVCAFVLKYIMSNGEQE